MKLTLFDAFLNVKLWFATIFLQMSFDAFFTKYIFADVEFLKWLFIAMAVDLATGLAKVWRKQGYQAITSKGLRDTVTKFIQYGGFLIITHVLTHFQIGGQPVTTWTWINKVAYEFVLMVEIKSVYENVVAINPKLDFVTKVIKKIAEAMSESKKDGTS